MQMFIMVSPAQRHDELSTLFIAYLAWIAFRPHEVMDRFILLAVDTRMRAVCFMCWLQFCILELLNRRVAASFETDNWVVKNIATGDDDYCCSIDGPRSAHT